MPLIAPVARIARISFQTSMTRGDAPSIPLGFMLEAAWPDDARWLGLIGRTRLTDPELSKVNLATWPDLEKPFDLMAKLFDLGWDAPLGEACDAIESEAGRTALLVTPSDASSLLAAAKTDAAGAWTETTNMLSAQLRLLGLRLIPTPVPPPRVLPFAPRHVVVPRIGLPIEKREKEEPAQLAA